MRALVAAILLVATPAASAGEPELGHPEMKAMFVADQAARHGRVDDWEAVSKADAVRRLRVRELLDAGQLATPHDFYAAAFIFQHGENPDDYLLAHALAIRALGLGMKEAEWIAAATLDRYLQSIGREQVYGTQYQRRTGEDSMQGAYNRDLLTDQIRTGAGVETREEQERKLDRLNTHEGDTE